MPKYHKLHRGCVLAMFIASSISSYFNPHMLYISAFSILGVIAYDVVCYLKSKADVKDYGPEIEKLREDNIQVLEKLQDIRNDASIGKLAETFRRK